MLQALYINRNFAVRVGYLFLLMVFPLVQPAADGDPLVLRVGDTQLTRNEFEQRFGYAMVLAAVSSGTPIKSGMLIRTLRRNYLDQTVTELLWLQEAARRGIEVTNTDLEAEISNFLRITGAQYKPGPSPDVSGHRVDHSLRHFLHEQLLLRRLRQDLTETGGLDQSDGAKRAEYVESLVAQYRLQTEIEVYPERLD